MLPVEQWLEIDRYALALTRELQTDCTLADYERYEFHRVVQALQTFCSRGSRRLLPRYPQGSALHHGAGLRARRSAQSRPVAHHRPSCA